MSTKERPTDGICVTVPDESSIVTVATGEPYAVEIENGRRVVYLPPEDARRLLNNGLECSIPWREANPVLAERLGPMPKLGPGLHIASYLQALEASRPLHPRDVIGHLREMGRLR